MDYLTTTFNSDGSPLFKSSSFSIWPIQFVINEMPFDVRIARPMVSGLWFRRHKPDMNVFLKPFVSYMNRLPEVGVPCIVENVERQIKIYTKCCVVDAVARPLMQGLSQFTGYFGCSWCLHLGTYVKSGKKGCVKYTLQEEPSYLRNKLDTIELMQQCVTTNISGKQSIFGVKRPTCLINLNEFDFIKDTVVDSMHACDRGVAEQMLRYWSNNLFSKEEMERISEVMLKLKVPNQISRLSRSLKDRSNWKAREWCNWILYYSLPILQMFPHLEAYAVHWSVFVNAYHILLQNSITRSEIEVAHNLLKEFVFRTDILYSKADMTHYVHQLKHLAQSVLDYGPLWAHTGYVFESGNGYLVRKVKAANGVLQQVCRSISMR